MHNKKSQAAMEFLMTYGWAILIVLIVLAVLYGLGVFNPNTINNICNPDGQISSCEIKLVSGTTPNSNSISLKYPNSLSDVNLLTDGVGGGIICEPVSGDAVTKISSNIVTTFTCSASPGEKNDRYSGTIKISYKSINEINHIATLKISGTIE